MRAPAKKQNTPHITALWMPAVISLMVLLAALVIVMYPESHGPDAQKWAFGVIGLILGHWFKK
jgi:hypothetical protein